MRKPRGRLGLEAEGRRDPPGVLVRHCPGFHGFRNFDTRESHGLIGCRADEFCKATYIVGDRGDDIRVAKAGM